MKDGPAREIPREGEVDAWVFDLDAPPLEHDALESVLAVDERARRDRFRRACDRRRYAAGRGALRHVLARYSGDEPGEVELGYTVHGKPFARRGPLFNLSHSAGLMVLCVGESEMLGVDVEHLRVLPDALELAAQVFVEPEIEVVRALPEPERSHRFLLGWTAKEAVLKALGTGLSLPATRIVLDLDAPVIRLARVDVPGEDARGWRLGTFTRGPEARDAAVITVAVRPSRLRLRFPAWSEEASAGAATLSGAAGYP